MNTETKGKSIGKILLIFFLVLAFTGIGILLQVFVRQSTDLTAKKDSESEIQKQIENKNKEIAGLEKEKEKLNSKLQEQQKKAAEKKQQKAQEELPGLLDRITPVLEEQVGTWSVYVKNLENGQYEKYNDAQMKGAGLLKLYVMGAAYAYTQNQNGSIQADEKFVESIHTMIGSSDNEVANQILSQIGGIDYVNQYIKENGYEKTILEDQFGDGSTTSVLDCGKFLESVYKNCEEKAGNSESENISDRMIADLRNQVASGKICEGLEQAGGFANKTGDLDGVENEVAIVFNEHGPDYIICIMSQDIDKASAPEVIQRLSSEVYNYFRTDGSGETTDSEDTEEANSEDTEEANSEDTEEANSEDTEETDSEAA